MKRNWNICCKCGNFRDEGYFGAGCAVGDWERNGNMSKFSCYNSVLWELMDIPEKCSYGLEHLVLEDEIEPASREKLSKMKMKMTLQE